MALSLKEQFQIKTTTAYTAADGKRFLDLTDAQTHTRDQMLESAITLAIKQNANFARLDKPLLKEFLLLSGAVVGQIMAEPLAPVDPVFVTNTPRAGESPDQTAARDRIGTGYKVNAPDDAALVERLRAAAGANTRPTVNVEPAMPAVKNPDIFQNRTLQAARAVDEADLDRSAEEALTRSVG